MNNELVQYIENEIFPLYNRNEEGHGIKHIKTVIKKELSKLIKRKTNWKNLSTFNRKIWRKRLRKNIFRR